MEHRIEELEERVRTLEFQIEAYLRRCDSTVATVVTAMVQDRKFQGDFNIKVIKQFRKHKWIKPGLFSEDQPDINIPDTHTT